MNEKITDHEFQKQKQGSAWTIKEGDIVEVINAGGEKRKFSVQTISESGMGWMILAAVT